jgi:hypothetical protein
MEHLGCHFRVRHSRAHCACLRLRAQQAPGSCACQALDTGGDDFGAARMANLVVPASGCRSSAVTSIIAQPAADCRASRLFSSPDIDEAPRVKPSAVAADAAAAVAVGQRVDSVRLLRPCGCGAGASAAWRTAMRRLHVIQRFRLHCPRAFVTRQNLPLASLCVAAPSMKSELDAQLHHTSLSRQLKTIST